MAKRSDLRGYLDASGGLPRDVLLGHLVLFTVNDGQYLREDVEKWFDDLSLNPRFVPPPNKAVDAYKKATSLVDDEDYPLPDGTEAHVLMRDVYTDGEMIVRHMVREIRDHKRRRLEYGKVGEALFYKASTQNGRVVPGTERFKLALDTAAMTENERESMKVIKDLVEAAYDRHVRFMDGMKIRAMIRDYVLHLNAVALKPSVYFVHASRLDELHRLRELVSRLGNGCSLSMIPLVDLAEQRQMVIDAFQSEASDALAGVVKTIQNLRETRSKITPDAYAKVKAEYDAVVMRATEYTRTLDITQDRTAGAAEVALEALAALQMQMLNGGATP